MSLFLNREDFQAHHREVHTSTQNFRYTTNTVGYMLWKNTIPAAVTAWKCEYCPVDEGIFMKRLYLVRHSAKRHGDDVTAQRREARPLLTLLSDVPALADIDAERDQLQTASKTTAAANDVSDADAVPCKLVLTTVLHTCELCQFHVHHLTSALDAHCWWKHDGERRLTSGTYAELDAQGKITSARPYVMSCKWCADPYTVFMSKPEVITHLQRHHAGQEPQFSNTPLLRLMTRLKYLERYGQPAIDAIADAGDDDKLEETATTQSTVTSHANFALKRCPVCAAFGKIEEFRSNGALRRHMQRVHPRKQP